jgi:hypothetical protein
VGTLWIYIILDVAVCESFCSIQVFEVHRVDPFSFLDIF